LENNRNKPTDTGDRQAMNDNMCIVAGDSMSRYTDSQYVRTTVEQIVADLASFNGGRMSIQGYTSPGSIGHGKGLFHVSIERRETNECAMFLVVFGETAAGARIHIREWVSEGAWSEGCGGKVAYVAGWDEAWLMICLIGQRMNIASVGIVYGG
jgi:hypothetical protein